MNYTKSETINQVEISNPQEGVIYIPVIFERFRNTETYVSKNKKGEDIYVISGFVLLEEGERTCECGCKMHVHDTLTTFLKNEPIGGKKSVLKVEYSQLMCSECKRTKIQKIPFKVENHFITTHVEEYISDLLAINKFTIKEIQYLTGVSKNIIKEIDLKRLKNKYVIENSDGSLSLFKPEVQAEFIAIDEFSLHGNHKYATHIIDLATGHILWIAIGKKKQVVYDFIEHVGLEWMEGVKAVACDMNSDFEEAFKEKCPNIVIVYDHFHIIKNFNEIVSKIRIEEQNKLKEKGDIEGAKKLKNTRYILTSKTETLDKKDEEVSEEKVISKGSELFKKPEVVRKGNYRERYEELIKSNEIFLLIELIKELLKEAYDDLTPRTAKK